MKFLGYFSLAFILMFMRAFVLEILWRWFLVPLGLIPLSVAQIAGILVIIHYFQLKPTDKTELTSEEIIKGIVFTITSSLTMLLIGLVIKSFCL